MATGTNLAHARQPQTAMFPAIGPGPVRGGQPGRSSHGHQQAQGHLHQPWPPAFLGLGLARPMATFTSHDHQQAQGGQTQAGKHGHATSSTRAGAALGDSRARYGWASAGGFNVYRVSFQDTIAI